MTLICGEATESDALTKFASTVQSDISLESVQQVLMDATVHYYITLAIVLVMMVVRTASWLLSLICCSGCRCYYYNDSSMRRHRHSTVAVAAPAVWLAPTLLLSFLLLLLVSKLSNCLRNASQPRYLVCLKSDTLSLLKQERRWVL